MEGSLRFRPGHGYGWVTGFVDKRPYLFRARDLQGPGTGELIEDNDIVTFEPQEMDDPEKPRVVPQSVCFLRKPEKIVLPLNKPPAIPTPPAPDEPEPATTNLEIEDQTSKSHLFPGFKRVRISNQDSENNPVMTTLVFKSRQGYLIGVQETGSTEWEGGESILRSLFEPTDYNLMVYRRAGSKGGAQIEIEGEFGSGLVEFSENELSSDGQTQTTTKPSIEPAKSTPKQQELSVKFDFLYQEPRLLVTVHTGVENLPVELKGQGGTTISQPKGTGKDKCAKFLLLLSDSVCTEGVLEIGALINGTLYGDVWQKSVHEKIEQKLCLAIEDITQANQKGYRTFKICYTMDGRPAPTKLTFTGRKKSFLAIRERGQAGWQTGQMLEFESDGTIYIDVRIEKHAEGEFGGDHLIVTSDSGQTENYYIQVGYTMNLAENSDKTKPTVH